jgi:formylglycine-generating enzyme required for sulfatase activity
MRRIIRVISPLLLVLASQVTLYAALAIPLVQVGNPGNVSDSTGFGGVGVAYSIGQYEVTNSQYTEFLNAVDPSGANSLSLYSGLMTSEANGGVLRDLGASVGSRYSVKGGRGDNPVVFVSWYSALRFANWLHNGQGSGNTETGAYTLGALGANGVPLDGNITRNSGATWFLPSENEWYKAAYYDGNTGTYSDFPTQTNATPFSDQSPGSGSPDQDNAGNFYKNDSSANGYDDGYAVTGLPGLDLTFTQNYLTNRGAYTEADSFYGTFDQGGNVAEWTEAFLDMDMLERTIRGGSWFRDEDDLLASFRDGEEPHNLIHTVGFRIAATAVPEPGALLLLGLVGTLFGLVHYFTKRLAR